MSEQRTGASDGDLVSSRTFHVPACGGFIIHERTAEVTTLFREDEEIACYSGTEELIGKIDEFLLDEPRRRLIAAQGHAMVEARHSWDARILQILEHHEQSWIAAG
jgi:spore maturation protein CgeB